MHYFVGHVSCLGVLGVILRKKKTNWVACGFCLGLKNVACGQTPPLDKCEQLDLEHPKAMLHDDVCPKIPRGGGGGEVFVSWPVDYTFRGRETH